MADLKLFHITNGKTSSLKPTKLSLEKEIQKLCESNMSNLLGVRFLQSEYSTGQKHGGRIDTLGIDENSSPVIVEYKKGSNENVINQGLYYLDWLMDHKGEFEMLCMDKLGERLEVDWTNPRLICIANDFTKYDDYAIGQINRNIDLIRYRMFEGGYLIFELASTSSQLKSELIPDSKSTKNKTIKDYLTDASKDLKDLYKEIENYIFILGDDIQKKELKFYIAYARIKNFACLEIHPSSNRIMVYIKVQYKDVDSTNKHIRNMAGIGHYGTGDTELTIRSIEDLEWALPLIEKSYEVS